MFYQRELRWAEEAELLKPRLTHEPVPAAAVVQAKENPDAWQGWTVERIAAPEEIYGRELPREERKQYLESINLAGKRPAGSD